MVNLILLGMNKCNTAKFRCDTFTIMIKSYHQPRVVQVVQISSEVLVYLYENLGYWSIDPCDVTRSTAFQQVFATIRGGPVGLGHHIVSPNRPVTLGNAATLMDCAAFLIQMYSLGLVMYTGSHS